MFSGRPRTEDLCVWVGESQGTEVSFTNGYSFNSVCLQITGWVPVCRSEVVSTPGRPPDRGLGRDRVEMEESRRDPCGSDDTRGVLNPRTLKGLEYSQ